MSIFDSFNKIISHNKEQFYWDNKINNENYKSSFGLFLKSNNYYFVNWLHGDLIFAHNDFRD